VTGSIHLQQQALHFYVICCCLTPFFNFAFDCAVPAFSLLPFSRWLIATTSSPSVLCACLNICCYAFPFNLDREEKRLAWGDAICMTCWFGALIGKSFPLFGVGKDNCSSWRKVTAQLIITHFPTLHCVCYSSSTSTYIINVAVSCSSHSNGSLFVPL